MRAGNRLLVYNGREIVDRGIELDERGIIDERLKRIRDCIDNERGSIDALMGVFVHSSGNLMLPIFNYVGRMNFIKSGSKGRRIYMISGGSKENGDFSASFEVADSWTQKVPDPMFQEQAQHPELRNPYLSADLLNYAEGAELRIFPRAIR